MIINAQQSDIQVTGDITEFKSSIDPKNLEFITTLLSSNLYSAPERSFMREIVSNAWDSQVEAGTTNVPIIIKITEGEATSYTYARFTGYGDITIRDFGTGLSPERFNEVYRNIGSSTKRESNDYHGAFGIGHLSGFSCSNTMYITSYYNGTCYEYIGIKDANTIVYTLVATYPTTESNGLEVTLKNVYLSKYRESLKYISFFPNLFLDDNNPTRDISINDIKIKKYNNFWVANYPLYDKLLLGNVLYPLNISELGLKKNVVEESRLIEFLDNINYTGVVLKFGIGELSVTPNRESIIYTKECIDKIINKIRAVKEEIDNLINEKAKEDFTDLLEYTKVINDSKSFDFFNGKICNYTAYLYKIPRYQALNLTYKNRNLSPYIALLRMLITNIEYCSEYFICDGRIYRVNQKIPYKYKCYLNLYNIIGGGAKILILKENIKLGKYLRNYLLSIYSDCYVILNQLDVANLKYYLGVNTIASYSNTADVDFILQEFIDYIYSKGTIVDFNNDADFIKYKKECKEEAKLNRKINAALKNKDITIWMYKYLYHSAIMYTFHSLNEAVEWLKNLHKGIVIIERDTTDNIKEVILQKNFIPIFVNKQIKEVLKEYSFNVELDWVLHKDPYLDYYKTILETFVEEYSLTAKLKALKDIISSNYTSDINDIMNVYNSYMNNSAYGRYAKNNGKTDKSLKNRLLKIKEFLGKYDEAVDFVNSFGMDVNVYEINHNKFYMDIITKVLIKNKSFMINPTAYRSVKNNKLINKLCKK